jgi:AraC family transcriptional regulator
MRERHILTSVSITFSLSLKGVIEMNYSNEQKDSLVVVGIKQRFSNIKGFGEYIGMMWGTTPVIAIGLLSELGDILLVI